MPLSDYLPIVPWVTTAVAVFYAITVTCKNCGAKRKGGAINKDIQKDSDKVVHIFDIEDLGDKTSLCRCWKSAKFPYCDGTHNKHNEACGDNVGPVVVKKKGA